MTDPRKGNDWARGIVSGGAPEGNHNAMKDGLQADPTNLFGWLWENEEHGANWVIDKLLLWQERASYDLFITGTIDMENSEKFEKNLTAMGDEVLTTVIRDYQKRKGEKKQMVDGLTTTQYVFNGEDWVEQEEENPINLPLDRLDRTSLRHKKALGLLDTPEEQQAQSTDKFAEAMKELAEEQDG